MTWVFRLLALEEMLSVRVGGMESALQELLQMARAIRPATATGAVITTPTPQVDLTPIISRLDRVDANITLILAKPFVCNCHLASAGEER